MGKLEKYFLAGSLFVFSLMPFSSFGQDNEGLWQEKSSYGIDPRGSFNIDNDSAYERLSFSFYAEKGSDKYVLNNFTLYDRNNDGFYEGTVLQNIPAVFNKDNEIVGQKSLTKTEVFRFEQGQDEEKELAEYSIKKEAKKKDTTLVLENRHYENIDSEKVAKNSNEAFYNRLETIKEIPEGFDFDSGLSDSSKLFKLLLGESVRHSFRVNEKN